MRVGMRDVAAGIKEGRPFYIEYLFLNTTEALAEFHDTRGDASGHVIEIGVMDARQDQSMAGSDRMEDKNGENFLVPINLMGGRGGRELTKETIQGQRRSLSVASAGSRRVRTLDRVVPRHEFIDAIDLVIQQAFEHATGASGKDLRASNMARL